jgi:hypothetical protein
MAQILMNENHTEQKLSLESNSNTAISFNNETELNEDNEARENNSNTSPSQDRISYML